MTIMSLIKMIIIVASLNAVNHLFMPFPLSHLLTNSHIHTILNYNYKCRQSALYVISVTCLPHPAVINYLYFTLFLRQAKASQEREKRNFDVIENLGARS